MTEADLSRPTLLEAGVYPFEVIGASEEISKAGNEMIKIKINVRGDKGQSAHIYDYLMEKMAFKLRHFCEATGLLVKYEAGTLSQLDCEGKKGWVRIKVEPAKGNYDAKNSVEDYIKPIHAPASDVQRKLTPEEFNKKHGLNSDNTFDDDITF